MMAGQQLLERWMNFIQRYVSLTNAQALTCALWAINTWTYQHFSVVPYLEIWAMHKRSGKSTLAEVLAALSNGGSVVATVRVLQMVRIIEAKQGNYTPFVEEAERFWKGTLGDERAILATGYRKGAAHELAGKQGIERYRTFSPKAFVLIGNLHDILRDRCLSIKLERSAAPRSWTLDRTVAETEAADLVGDLLKASKAMTVDRTADGDVRFRQVDPEWITSARDRELWMPLFSVAAAMHVHADTMALLQRASVDLSILKTLPAVRYRAGQDEVVGDDGNAAEAVLRDLRACFKDDDKALTTDEALARLYAMNTAPWRGWQGEGLSAIALSALLERFGIRPEQIWIGSGKKTRKQARGYKRVDVFRPTGK